MTAVYLLPCHGGKSVEVTVANAGRTVVCPCGKEVLVPTLRELSRLPRANDVTPGRSANQWSLQQGIFFSLGLLVIVGAVVAVGVFAYYRLQIDTASPEIPDAHLTNMDKNVMELSSEDTLRLWQQLDAPLPPGEVRPQLMFEKNREDAYWLYVGMGVAGLFALAGMGLCTYGMVAKPRPPGKHRPPKPGQRLG